MHNQHVRPERAAHSPKCAWREGFAVVQMGKEVACSHLSGGAAILILTTVVKAH